MISRLCFIRTLWVLNVLPHKSQHWLPNFSWTYRMWLVSWFFVWYSLLQNLHLWVFWIPWTSLEWASNCVDLVKQSPQKSHLWIFCFSYAMLICFSSEDVDFLRLPDLLDVSTSISVSSSSTFSFSSSKTILGSFFTLLSSWAAFSWSDTMCSALKKKLYDYF